MATISTLAGLVKSRNFVKHNQLKIFGDGSLATGLLTIVAFAGMVDGQFHMTGIVQTPQPGEQGVTPEGETLSLVGSASSFWDICELTFNKELLCRTGPGSVGDCNTLNYNTSRIQGVAVLQTGNTLNCGFEMRSISSNDTGDWSIIMQAISGGSLVLDSKTVEVKVGCQDHHRHRRHHCHHRHQYHHHVGGKRRGDIVGELRRRKNQRISRRHSSQSRIDCPVQCGWGKAGSEEFQLESQLSNHVD